MNAMLNGYQQDRRRYPRTQLKLTLRSIRLDPDGGDVVDTLHMQDISKTGMGVVCDRPFYPGQRIVLCLPVTPMGGRRNVYARVIHCRQAKDGYSVGLEFDSLPLDTQNSFGGRAAAAA